MYCIHIVLAYFARKDNWLVRVVLCILQLYVQLFLFSKSINTPQRSKLPWLLPQEPLLDTKVKQLGARPGFALSSAKADLFSVVCSVACAGKMLCTLFRKSKAAKVSGVQEERMWTFPTWVRDNQWMSVAKELAKYASSLKQSWGGMDSLIFPQILV